MENAINIIITEDQPKWREVMRRELKPFNINIIAEAEHGAELLKLLETYNPDVILLDLEMPVMNGTETMRHLSEKHPKQKIMIMSLFDYPTLQNDYAERGAKGCCSKSDAAGSLKELAGAIRIVHEGGTYFNYGKNEVLPLSNKQKELITMFAEQKKTTEIAAELNVTTRAVEKQRKEIMNIFGLGTVSELYQKIYSLGLNYFRKPWRKTG